MSKFKKMTAVVLSVIMLVCMFAIPAGAANTKSSLIDVALDSVIKGSKSIVNLGQSLYLVNTENGSDIYRIGEDELKTWRSSGKLTPKKVTLSSDIPEGVYLRPEEYFTSSKGYAVISYYDSETYSNPVKVVKYDKSSNKITTVYNVLSDERISGMTTDGYISINSNGNSSIKIVSPNGKTLKTIKDANSSGFTWTSKYGYYIKWKNNKCTLYCYDTSGKTQKISKTYNSISIVYARYGGKAYPVGYIYSNISYGSDDYDEKDPNKGVYFTTLDGKFTAKMSQSFKVSYDKNNTYSFQPYGNGFEYLNGSVAVLTLLAKDENYPNDNPGSSYGTILVSLKNGKFNVLNNDYMSYSTEDGKIFTVSNYKNDKKIYGYINNKGKKLALSFDSAADFANGAKYTVVMKNGSAYVIDRKMNKVSESLKLKNTDSCQLFNETGTLWGYTTTDEKVHLVTYKGAIAA